MPQMTRMTKAAVAGPAMISISGVPLITGYIRDGAEKWKNKYTVQRLKETLAMAAI